LRIFPPPRILAAARSTFDAAVSSLTVYLKEAEVPQVYFHCSNANEVLIDRCGAMVDDLTEARDRAGAVVRSLTTARSLEDLAWLDPARQRRRGHRALRRFACVCPRQTELSVPLSTANNPVTPRSVTGPVI
jgi:hypothetical protein